MRRTALTYLLIGSAVATAAWAAQPAGVSPGHPAWFAGVQGTCPTFSWTEVEGAAGYEIRVYAAEGDRPVVADEPVLQFALPAGATGWTPPAEDCLKRGGRYAWSLRAVTASGSSGWSEPLLFQIAAPPSDEELAQALEVVRRHFDLAKTTGEQDPGPPDQDVDQASAAVSVDSPTPQPAAAPISAGDPAAKIKVEGEVRTVSPDGSGRLWGTGRTSAVYGTLSIFGNDIPCVSETAQHGLSTTATLWGSAAEACPVGTWVCESADVVACNTTRPDSFADALNCTGEGIDRAQNEHIGWVAEPSVSDDFAGTAVIENGLVGNLRKCVLAPVWCCWE